MDKLMETPRKVQVRDDRSEASSFSAFDDIDYSPQKYRLGLNHEQAVNSAERVPLISASSSSECCQWGAGLMQDIKRRGAHYASDFVDGFNTQSLSCIIYIYFVSLAPALTFGGLLGEETDQWLGATEMLLATSLCGMIYALLSGQPLVVIGGTGPVLIFTGVLFDIAVSYDIDFITYYVWVGYWTSLWLIMAVFLNASYCVKYFTRFTEETFSFLIATIFIWEAFVKMRQVWRDYPLNEFPNVALLSTLLGLFTCSAALWFKGFRDSKYLNDFLRRNLSKFAIAITLLIVVGIVMHLRSVVQIPSLTVPQHLRPTRSDRHAWVIDPFHDSRTGEPISLGVILGAAIAAILGSILMFMDHQITAVVINKPDFKTEKGPAYHLDLLVCAVCLGICSLFGFPWLVAATLRSIAHVQSLTRYRTNMNNAPTADGVIENRVTAFVVHLLIGLSILTLRPVIALLPNAVLYGLFLYMGIAALMEGNQFANRLKALFVFEPIHQAPLAYIRHVIPSRLLLYTAVQVACTVALWLIKMSIAAVIFPLFLLGLVGVRWMMERTGMFSKDELQILDCKDDLTDKDVLTILEDQEDLDKLSSISSTPPHHDREPPQPPHQHTNYSHHHYHHTDSISHSTNNNNHNNERIHTTYTNTYPLASSASIISTEREFSAFSHTSSSSTSPSRSSILSGKDFSSRSPEKSRNYFYKERENS